MVGERNEFAHSRSSSATSPRSATELAVRWRDASPHPSTSNSQARRTLLVGRAGFSFCGLCSLGFRQASPSKSERPTLRRRDTLQWSNTVVPHSGAHHGVDNTGKRRTWTACPINGGDWPVDLPERE